MKKTFFVFCSTILLLSCSADSEKFDDFNSTSTTSLSKVDDWKEIGKASFSLTDSNTKFKIESTYLETNKKDKTIIKNSITANSGETINSTVEFNKLGLYKVNYGAEESYFVEQLTENDFLLLDEKMNKIQKISMVYDNKKNLHIKTVEIYEDSDFFTGKLSKSRWYNCMTDRMSDPINQVLLVGAASAAAVTGGTSFLGYLAGVAGIGIYCAF